MTMPDKFDPYVFLHLMSKKHCDADLVELNKYVLENERFQRWPGSTDKHHSGEGGLILHTAEVLLTALDASKNNVALGRPALQADVLVTATIWHDFGKIWDYQPNPDYVPGFKKEFAEIPKPGENPRWERWIKAPHRTKIRHVARSYSEFMARTAVHDWRLGLNRVPWIEEVGHCILAHHGRLDWGSPVEPETPEAWALHLADMTSVRVFDRAIRT